MRHLSAGPLALLTAAVLGLCACGGEAGPPRKPGGEAQGKAPAKSSGDWRADAKKALDRGAAYLLKNHAEGHWGYAPGKPTSLAITGLATLALLRGQGAQALEKVRPALDWMAASQKADGAIYDQGPATYSTAIAVLALEASGDARYRPVIRKAAGYIRLVQFDEGEGHERSSKYYGGVGYDRENKPNPNLSTTAWTIEAARAAKIRGDDPFYERSLIFLQRMQNRSESNDATLEDKSGQKIQPGNDGGAFYSPQESKAGLVELDDGRKIYRSYGSMSYALLKSYLFCDLNKRDPRVKAVRKWLEANWSVARNPGMEHFEAEASEFMGLFYYYETIGRTLSTAESKGMDFEDTPLANWRREVALAVCALQSDDGSWTNSRQARWWEDSPMLVTAYAMTTLADCLR